MIKRELQITGATFNRPQVPACTSTAICTHVTFKSLSLAPLLLKLGINTETPKHEQRNVSQYIFRKQFSKV